jgi:hypothetical protein
LRSLYKASFCIRWMRLKYAVVLLISCIPSIAVTLFLQFVFVITNNRIKCCSRNVTNHSIQYYIIIFILRYTIVGQRIFLSLYLICCYEKQERSAYKFVSNEKRTKQEWWCVLMVDNKRISPRKRCLEGFFFVLL